MYFSVPVEYNLEEKNKIKEKKPLRNLQKRT